MLRNCKLQKNSSKNFEHEKNITVKVHMKLKEDSPKFCVQEINFDRNQLYKDTFKIC